MSSLESLRTLDLVMLETAHFNAMDAANVPSSQILAPAVQPVTEASLRTHENEHLASRQAYKQHTLSRIIQSAVGVEVQMRVAANPNDFFFAKWSQAAERAE